MNKSHVILTRIILLSAFFVSGSRANAQADLVSTSVNSRPATIVGRVVDAKTGSGITDATIVVEGAGVGTRSIVDGRFNLNRVPSGEASILVRRLGYAAKRIANITVEPGSVVEQNISLDATTVALATTVVTAAAEKGTVNEALDRQRTATAIINSVTADQITKSGDGDAAQAVKRVSGVTLQSGRYVFVRGLGERYTTASLDGARIPSPEPEKKVVPLDLFPSGLLESVTTTKTFTPDLPGDFSGAQVDIQTREFAAKKVASWSSGVGFNSSTTGRQILVAPTTGGEWIAFGGGSRSLPGLVKAAGDFGSLSAQDANKAAHAFRNAWTPRAENGKPNYSTGVSIGGRTTSVLPGLGYLASATYGFSQETHADEQRAIAVPGANGGTKPYNAFSGSTASTSVLWGGLLNLNALIGGSTLVTLNNNYNRSADNEARQARGTLDDFGFESVRSSLGLIERSVRSNQLRLLRSFGSHELNASITSSGVTRTEPDRSELQYVREPDPATGAPLPFALFSYNPEGARRTFADLSETGLDGSVGYQLTLGAAGRETHLKFGAAHRMTDRDAENSSYSLMGYKLTRSVRELPAEQIFDPARTNSGTADLTVLLNSTGGSYSARDRVSAGYAMFDFPLGSNLRVIGGARLEHSNIVVNSIATSGERASSKLNNTDVLPSLVANYSLRDNQSLRLSVSRTLSRPEYRELSPVTYRDVIEQQDIFGNPSLKRSLITNVDGRWEWFPNSGEVIGLGLFAKRFSNPIERVDVATSGASRLGFINADGATNYGVEFEVRKSLFEQLTTFGNATVMKSTIDITSDKLSSLTNRKRAMVGQAPYVVNAGATWATSSARSTATVVYNVVGRRITSAGTTPLPDTYELARSGLDLSLQSALFGSLSARFDAKNLLDSPYSVQQGSVIREQYRSGRVFSFGLKWQQ